MITKHIAGRKDGKSSAADALRYGEGLTPDRETGEMLDKSHRTRLGNYGLVDDGVYAGREAAEMADLIEVAAIEMQSNCDLNTRVGADKKIAHFIFSFNQDKPSEAVLRDTEDSMLSALKLDKNHFATFLHNDNGHWHLHIFASRIEKEKPHRGNPLWQDKTIRDKVCREIEIRHGLTRDNGLHEIKGGQIVEIPRDVRRAKRDAKPTGISDRAKTTEIYSGEKSFQTWCNEIRIGDRMKHAKSWQDLHAAVAAYGCEVKMKGAGFIICPAGEKGGIQLSKVGLKNLPSKFGAFEDAKLGHQAQPETAYKPEPTNKEGASHYTAWRASRDAFKPVKTGQINEQREAHKQIRKDLRASQKTELEKIRAKAKGPEKFAAISIAKMQHSVELSALADQFSRNRQALHRQLAAEGPGSTFRDFLVRAGEKGDNIALGLARKYGVDESTDVSRQREAGQLQIVAAVAGHEYRPAKRMQFTHQVERTGTVVYNFGNGRIVTDSAISKQIQLNSIAASDPAAIETSLRFATAKFGNTLTLTGPPEFQRLAVETAVRERLGIKFADPTLEAYREKLVAEQQRSPFTNTKEKRHAPNNRIERFRQIPPAQIRDRLHNLSIGDLVLDTQRDVSALRSNVHDGVEQHQEGGDHGMQRAAGRTERDGGSGAAAGRYRSRTATAPSGLRPASSEVGNLSAGQSGVVPVVASSIPSGAAGQAQRAAALAAEKPIVTQPPPQQVAAEPQQVETPQPTTGAEWIAAQHKPVVPAQQGDGAVKFTVAYLAPDSVVIDHGRGVAVYPIPQGVDLQVGQKIVINKGSIALPIGRSGQEAGRAG